MVHKMTIRFGSIKKEGLLDRVAISILAKMIFNRSLYNHYSLTTYEDLAKNALLVSKVSKNHKDTIDLAITTLEDEGLIKVIGNYKNVIEYQLLEYEETGLEFDLDTNTYKVLINKLDNLVEVITYFFIKHSVENEIPMSYSTLGGFMNCSKQTVMRAVSVLEDKKLISTYLDKVYENDYSSRTITKYKLRGLLEGVK